MKTTRWMLKMTVIVLGVAGGSALALASDAMPPATAATTAAVKHQTICPIEGGEINKKLFADYQGKRVYFCCAGCPPVFKKDPEKYIKKMESQGITLDKTP